MCGAPLHAYELSLTCEGLSHGEDGADGLVGGDSIHW
jgi:hypothetical protein